MTTNKRTFSPFKVFLISGFSFFVGFTVCLVLYGSISGSVYDDAVLSDEDPRTKNNDSIIIKLENGMVLSSSTSNTMSTNIINHVQSSAKQQVDCQQQHQERNLNNQKEDDQHGGDDGSKNDSVSSIGRRSFEHNDLVGYDIHHSGNQILEELDALSGGPDALNLVCPYPLVPFQNRIVKSNDTISTERIIPKVLHVSMKSRCLPQDLARIMDRWKLRFRNYSIFFHDDNAVQRLITGEEWPEFPGFHRAMKCVLLKGAMVIDIWRVLLLWKYGGVYTDIDNWPEDAFTEDVIPANLTAFFFSDPNNRPSQWFMALEPRYPIMYESMLHVIHHIFEMGNLRQPQLVQVTGPFAIRMGYAVFLSRLRKDGMEAVFQNNKVLTGTASKTVYKSSNGTINAD